MSTDTDAKLTQVIAATLVNPATVLSAFQHVGSYAVVGFDLAAACAMVQAESGGHNVWGHDPWDQAAYPKGFALAPGLEGELVTHQNYAAYRAARNDGLQPQGCGPAQLTSAGLQHAAELAGGCWVPFYNLRVGFAFLKELFTDHGSALAGFTAYNGSGPAAAAYGQAQVERQGQWQIRFNRALEATDA